MTVGITAIGLFQVKDKANIGGALRAAHAFSAQLIAIQSKRLPYTPTDTTKAARHIPTFLVEDILEATPHGCQRVAVEVRADATPLPMFKHPRQAFYIFGPEDGSLPERVVAKCQHRVQIPTDWCLNLAAAVNVVLYDRIAKQMLSSEPK